MDLFRPIEACRVLEDAVAELDAEDSALRQLLEAALAMCAWISRRPWPPAFGSSASTGTARRRGRRARMILAQKAMAMWWLDSRPRRSARPRSEAIREAGELTRRARSKWR